MYVSTVLDVHHHATVVPAPNRKALYHYCRERGIPHRRCGKLVVASSDSQLPALRELRRRAEACGVGDVRLVGATVAREMEPHVLCTEVRPKLRGETKNGKNVV